ncbi:hypothetical protein XENORESO_019682 [Xenotaenia resolanae]|uniref:Uncharacterized protein n=1 Tax=Xenotaenia resolanae TaxID=208358 RepID=A0ABV0W0J3_9TELE
MFDEIEKSEEEDQVAQFYKDIATYIQKLECQSEEEPPVKESVRQKDLRDTIPCASSGHTTDYSPKIQPEPTRSLQEVTFRREFKICGKSERVGRRISYPILA